MAPYSDDLTVPGVWGRYRCSTTPEPYAVTSSSSRPRVVPSNGRVPAPPIAGDPQVHLIDQPALEQAARELAATGQEEIIGDVVLQPPNPVDRVTVNDLRVPVKVAGERA